MPKKKNLTGARILALALAFITLCLGGGVTLAVLFLPTVMGAANSSPVFRVWASMGCPAV